MIKRKGASTQDIEALYKTESSFIDLLPWVEALENAILLEDGVSVGAIFDITPKGTEGRAAEFLEGIRDGLDYLLRDSFEELEESPWVMQTFTFKEPELSGYMQMIRDYVKPAAKGTQFTDAYLDILEKHYKDVCKPGGLFEDKKVTHSMWGGCQLRSYVVIYQRIQAEEKTGMFARAKSKIKDSIDYQDRLEALEDACERFTGGLVQLGIKYRRMSGNEFHRWMTRWFNKYTEFAPDNPLGLIEQIEKGSESVPFGDRFTESMFYSYPVSDLRGKYWRFDQTYSRCILAEGFRDPPYIGDSTGEISRGDACNSLMDLLPSGTVMVSTVVICPGDTVEAIIDGVSNASRGDSAGAKSSKIDCEKAKELLGEKNRLHRARYAFYINANSEKDLNRKSKKAGSILTTRGVQAMAYTDDARALDTYVSNLPMRYDANIDRVSGWSQAKLTWTQHIANFSCFFGRSTGTGNPGFLQFNRGGEPLAADPLNKNDRETNAHMFICGETGAGKSVTLAGTLSHELAIHRPRVFIIEAGNSFGVLGHWYKSLGLTVNAVSIKPGTTTALPTFADAHLIFEQETLLKARSKKDKPGVIDEDERDVLEEMTAIARLMITGGERKYDDALERSDIATIQQAIKHAAKVTEPGRTLTEDVRDAFYHVADLEELDSQKQRIKNMGASLGIFCEGFTGDIFNRHVDSWEEADVTIIDLGSFAGENYKAHLAVSVMGIVNVINRIAERDQFDDREIVVAFDEAHLSTKNPLISGHLVRISKMWRKLGCWLCLATQSIGDFKDGSEALLAMLEWWICLVMKPDAITKLATFKELTDEQKTMLLSSRKSDRQYTEGVILSNTMNTLFRSVPPSLVLTLAMTEKHEKAERHALMEKHDCTELEAAVFMAKEIDIARGLNILDGELVA